MNKIARLGSTVADPSKRLAPEPVAPGDGGAVEVEPLSEQTRRWRTENRDAIESYNRWIAEYGLPLEEFRRF